MCPLCWFYSVMAARRARRIHALESRRCDVIKRQMEEGRAAHREWRPLLSEMRRSRHAMLRAEVTLKGMR